MNTTLWRKNADLPGDCPRCGESLPVGYHGAMSRVDNKTEICSACGTDEALVQLANRGLLEPLTAWPLIRQTELDQRLPRRSGPCPCECNSGGFCGGCGHAGCSGGINLTNAQLEDRLR